MTSHRIPRGEKATAPNPTKRWPTVYFGLEQLRMVDILFNENYRYTVEMKKV
jgi:hypothetical protein